MTRKELAAENERRRIKRGWTHQQMKEHWQAIADGIESGELEEIILEAELYLKLERKNVN